MLTDKDLDAAALAERLRTLDSSTTDLQLSRNKLESLPSALFTFVRLTKLRINSNLLSEVPAAIAALSHLEALDLSNNRLRALPDELFRLTQLEILHARANSLQYIAPSCVQLKKLTQLCLFDNVPLPTALAIDCRKLDDAQKLLLEISKAPLQLPSNSPRGGAVKAEGSQSPRGKAVTFGATSPRSPQMTLKPPATSTTQSAIEYQKTSPRAVEKTSPRAVVAIPEVASSTSSASRSPRLEPKEKHEATASSPRMQREAEPPKAVSSSPSMSRSPKEARNAVDSNSNNNNNNNNNSNNNSSGAALTAVKELEATVKERDDLLRKATLRLQAVEMELEVAKRKADDEAIEKAKTEERLRALESRLASVEKVAQEAAAPTPVASAPTPSPAPAAEPEAAERRGKCVML